MGDDAIDLDARRVHRQPSARHRQKREARQLASAAHEATDAIVQAARTASTVELLHLQRLEVAREAASLRFDRMFGSTSADTGRLISRRVRALRAVADATLQIHELEAGSPSPVVVRRIVALLTDDVVAAGRAVFDSATADRLEVAVRRRVDACADQLIAIGSSRS